MSVLLTRFDETSRILDSFLKKNLSSEISEVVNWAKSFRTVPLAFSAGWDPSNESSLGSGSLGSGSLGCGDPIEM